MKIHVPHAWNLSYQEAVSVQNQLCRRVRLRTSAKLNKRLQDPELLIGGADISYSRHSTVLYAVIVTMRLGDFGVVERVAHRMKAPFPYIPGLLSFREIPPLIETYQRIKQPPDVMLCDGQGLAHPRRFGLACHMGVLLGVPTVGCAKSRLIGQYREPGQQRGNRTQLRDGEEVIGSVLRTRQKVKPLFISVGHQIALCDAIGLVLKCTPKYRIPEPIRQAHMTVNYVRLSLEGK